MNKVLYLISFAFIAYVCWIASFFPLIVMIIPFFFINKGDFNFTIVHFMAILITGIIIFIKCRKNLTKELYPDEDCCQLQNIYPSQFLIIMDIVNKLHIKKPIKLYVRNSEEKNAECEVNYSNAYIVFNSSILSTDEYIPVFYHELFHINNWIVYYITKEICLIYNEIQKGCRKINEKANSKFILKLIDVPSLTNTFTLAAYSFYSILLMLLKSYCMFFDEVLADFYSVDMTKGTKIIDVIKDTYYISITNNPIDELFYNSHLHSVLRCKLIRKYHYLKYTSRNWLYSIRRLICSAFLIVSLYVLLMVVFKDLLPIALNALLSNVTYLWVKAFNNDKEIATLAFALILSLVGFIWNTCHIIIEYKRSKPLHIIVRRLGLICLSLFFGCAILLSIFSSYSGILFKILTILMFLFLILGYLCEYLKKKSMKQKEPKIC